MNNVSRIAGRSMRHLCFIAMLFSACNSDPRTADKETSTGNINIQTNPDVSRPADAPAGFKHAMADVNGVTIHYVTGGKGDPLVLIHGFGQNWYMWNRIMPELAKHFTLIVPDLRGVGESSKPDSGYDKKTMATDIHELVKKLGYKNISLAGHDIGLMVAYAYTALYGSEVKKVAFMDALIPGIEPIWQQVSTTAWWFGFFARKISGSLVAGHEREFLTDFWPQVGFKSDPFSKGEINEFVRAYAQPGATTGSFHWFGAFAQDVIDNHQFMKHKLQMPVLAMGGDHYAGAFLADHLKIVATNVTEVKIGSSGHWLVQENPEAVQQGLLNFFMDQRWTKQ